MLYIVRGLLLANSNIYTFYVYYYWLYVTRRNLETWQQLSNSCWEISLYAGNLL